MMKFLEGLYNIENFGIYLFVVIGFLVVIFLVILFFGKKDEQKRRKVENNETKKADFVATPDDDVVAFKETSVQTPLEVNVDKEKEIPFSPVIDGNDKEVTFEPVKFDSEPVNDYVTSTEQDKSKEFDFDALAEAISKELESLDNEKKISVDEHEDVKVPLLEKEEEKSLNYHVFEPIEQHVEIKEAEIIKPVEPVFEEKKVKPSMPTVFSSVYVNREKEEPVVSEVLEKEDEVEIVKPVAPKIELPKMMDLPKKK